MKTLYLDIFSGISGDMFIGAMLDLGVDLETLKSELDKLKVDAFHLHVHRQTKSGIEGFKFDVHDESAHEGHSHKHGPHSHGEHHHDDDHDNHDHDHEHGHTHGDHSHDERDHDHHHDHGESRNFSDIRKLILDSDLSDWVKEKSIAVFHRIAVAEGKIHGHPPEEVHFHEVGAIDSIVDIVGGCICLEQLGKPRVLAAPVTEGTGFVMCAHGRFPVPTMATLEILGERGVPLNQCEEPHELVTPTGAALLAEFAESFAPMTGLVAEKVGYGLGTRDNKTRPNVLRAILGNAAAATASPALDWQTDTVAILETNLDDINSEILGNLVNKALAAGALDVFHTPVQMKKNRPGVLVTVICAESEADAFSEMLLRETSAFGVRCTTAKRRKLNRQIRTVETRFGDIDVKLGLLNGKIVQVSPEFESCRKAATIHRVALKEVYAAAGSAALSMD